MINAVLHNKWVDGNEPMISVFSDRIEILSRGTLAPMQTMEGFFIGESVPVNEKLSEIFLQLHISEKSGRGVPKIIDKYSRDIFTFRENSIVVTIPFERINTVEAINTYHIEDKTEEPKEKTDTKSCEKLNARCERILLEMKNNPKITAVELGRILNISKTTVVNCISELKHTGYIERSGTSKTGYWVVNDGK
jgi:predicted HTH transcriptional regulator